MWLFVCVFVCVCVICVCVGGGAGGGGWVGGMRLMLGKNLLDQVEDASSRVLGDAEDAGRDFSGEPDILTLFAERPEPSSDGRLVLVPVGRVDRPMPPLCCSWTQSARPTVGSLPQQVPAQEANASRNHTVSGVVAELKSVRCAGAADAQGDGGGGGGGGRAGGGVDSMHRRCQSVRCVDAWVGGMWFIGKTHPAARSGIARRGRSLPWAST